MHLCHLIESRDESGDESLDESHNESCDESHDESLDALEGCSSKSEKFLTGRKEKEKRETEKRKRKRMCNF